MNSQDIVSIAGEEFSPKNAHIMESVQTLMIGNVSTPKMIAYIGAHNELELQVWAAVGGSLRRVFLYNQIGGPHNHGRKEWYKYELARPDMRLIKRGDEYG